MNEDNYIVQPDLSLYVVADGMGGHAAGEVASALAVETVEEFFHHANSTDDFTWPFEIDESMPFEANKLRTAIRLANRRIHRSAMEQHRLEGMGTTVVGIVLVLEQKLVCVGHVGDSRAYLLRNGKLWPLTTDHSWVNVQVMLGQISADEARHHPMKNIITRALGTREDVEVDLVVREICPGDFILLCSDGLSGLVEEDEMVEIILSQQGDLNKAADELIRRANANGGDDNITVVLVGIRSSIEEENPTPAESQSSEDTQDMAQLPTVRMYQMSAEELKEKSDPLLGGMNDWEEDLKKPIKPVHAQDNDDLDF